MWDQALLWSSPNPGQGEYNGPRVINITTIRKTSFALMLSYVQYIFSSNLSFPFQWIEDLIPVSLFSMSSRERTSTCCWMYFCWQPGEPSCWPAASTGWATNPQISPTLTTQRPTRPRSSPGCSPFSTCLPSTFGSSFAQTCSALTGQWTPCRWSGASLIGGTVIRPPSTLDCSCWLGSAWWRTTRRRARTPTAKRIITPMAKMATQMDTATNITIMNMWTIPTQMLILIVHKMVPKSPMRAGLHCPPLKMLWCSLLACWLSPSSLPQTCFSMWALW